MTENELIIRRLNELIERMDNRLSDWASDLQSNPLYHLSWGSDVYLNAAELKLAQEAIAFLKGDVNPDFKGDRLAQVRREWTVDVLRKACNIPSSTSATSNLAEAAELAAKARMLRDYFGPLAMRTFHPTAPYHITVRDFPEARPYWREEDMWAASVWLREMREPHQVHRRTEMSIGQLHSYDSNVPL